MESISKIPDLNMYHALSLGKIPREGNDSDALMRYEYAETLNMFRSGTASVIACSEPMYIEGTITRNPLGMTSANVDVGLGAVHAWGRSSLPNVLKLIDGYGHTVPVSRQPDGFAICLPRLLSNATTNRSLYIPILQILKINPKIKINSITTAQLNVDAALNVFVDLPDDAGEVAEISTAGDRSSCSSLIPRTVNRIIRNDGNLRSIVTFASHLLSYVNSDGLLPNTVPVPPAWAVRLADLKSQLSSNRWSEEFKDEFYTQTGSGVSVSNWGKAESGLFRIKLKIPGFSTHDFSLHTLLTNSSCPLPSTPCTLHLAYPPKELLPKILLNNKVLDFETNFHRRSLIPLVNLGESLAKRAITKEGWSEGEKIQELKALQNKKERMFDLDSPEFIAGLLFSKSNKYPILHAFFSLFTPDGMVRTSTNANKQGKKEVLTHRQVKLPSFTFNGIVLKPIIIDTTHWTNSKDPTQTIFIVTAPDGSLSLQYLNSAKEQVPIPSIRPSAADALVVAVQIRAAMLLDAKKLLNGEKTDRVKVVDEKRAVGVVKKNAAMKVRRKKTKLELSGEGSGPKKKLQKGKRLVVEPEQAPKKKANNKKKKKIAQEIVPREEEEAEVEEVPRPLKRLRRGRGFAQMGEEIEKIGPQEEADSGDEILLPIKRLRRGRGLAPMGEEIE